MFEISGIYGIKLMPSGQIVRGKSVFKMGLNTEDGVMRFIDEMGPFDSIAIKEVETKKDMTEYFLGPSRKETK